MRLIVPAECLLKALTLATHLLPARTPKVILRAVLIRADRKRGVAEVVVVIPDSHSLVAEIRNCAVEESGECLLEPGRAMDILRTFALDAEIKVSRENDSVFLRSLFAEFELPNFDDPDKYPSPPVEGDDEVCKMTVSRDDLLGAVALVQSCARTRTSMDMRYAMCGVSLWPAFEGELNRLELVCTDGKSLMHTYVPVHWDSGEPKNKGFNNPYLISTQALPVVRDLFGAGSCEHMVITLENNALSLADVRNTLRFCLPNGAFPRWPEILARPKSLQEVSVPANEWLQHNRIASICCDPQERRVKMVVGEGEVTIKSMHAGVSSFGISRSSMPVGIDGKGLKICYSPRAVDSLGRPFEDDDVIVILANPKHPVMLVDCERLRLRCAVALNQPKVE